MPINTFSGNFPQSNQAFFEKRMLSRANPLLHFYAACQSGNIKTGVPKNAGSTISYRRVNRLSVVPTPLNEGITPLGASLSMSEVVATLAQYGNYVTITDVVNDLAKDPIAREASDVMGVNGAELIETIIRQEMIAGTSVFFGGGKTSRGALTAIDIITRNLVQKAACRSLETNNAMPWSGSRNTDTGMMSNGQLYFGIIHPLVFDDLLGDADIKQVFNYQSKDGYLNCNLPVVANVAWHKTTLAPVFAGAGAGGVDVYATHILGAEAIAYPDIAATGKMDSYIHQPGSAGAADPLNQRGTIGFKLYGAPKILNNNFMVRLETGITP